MRLLQVITSLGAGGAEKLVVDATLLYIKQGLDVDVLLLNGENTPLYERLTEFKSVTIFSLKGNIYNPLNSFKIKSYFKNYDVIHAHLFPVSYWVAFANMLSFTKKPIVFTEHNTTNRRRSIFVFKIFDGLVYKQFKKIVTISDAVDKNLKVHLGLHNTKRILKIHNGIDLEKSKRAIPYTREEIGFKSTDQLLIQVASFTPQKDQKTLIKALKRLPKSVKLILVGHGPLINDLKNYVSAENLEDRVFFFGIRKDVPRLLKSVDVVVLSSHYEGLSLSCIEGMASGTPFVASNTPGLGDIVEGAGVLFDDENDNQLAAIISKLLEDKEYGNLIVKKCINKAQYFDINLMVSSYIELYKRLVKN